MVEKIFDWQGKKHSSRSATQRLFGALQAENLPIKCAHGINQPFLFYIAILNLSVGAFESRVTM